MQQKIECLHLRALFLETWKVRSALIVNGMQLIGAPIVHCERVAYRYVVQKVSYCSSLRWAMPRKAPVQPVRRRVPNRRRRLPPIRYA